MKITNFDKAACRALGADVENALVDVAEKHGVMMKYKGGTFSGPNFTMKLEFSVINKDGVAQTRERDDFIRYAGMYNLLPTDLDKTFKRLDGTYDEYKIVGLAMKSSKYPVLALNKTNGRVYKFSERAIQQFLGRKVDEPKFKFNPRFAETQEI